MLSKEQKREAISQFKERKTLRGIYAVRCTVDGQSWVGASRNLDATGNSVWFSLRQGGHREASLQAAWNAHGEPAFEYVVLEKLDDEASPLLIPNLLKDAKQRWITQLGARGLL